MSLVGSIFTGINKANAAKAAANAQTIGAQNAQKTEAAKQNQAQDFQNQEYQGDVSRAQPYVQEGNAAANRLTQIEQTPFTAPTLAEAQQTPGYQFTLQQGTNAINENAAATGTLLSGNTGAALERYGTGLADSTYQNDYQRALDTYMANYNVAQGGAQIGEQANSTLGQQGAMAASNNTNLALTGGAQQAQQINNAAAARASGYIGKATALDTTVNNANQTAVQLAALGMGA